MVKKKDDLDDSNDVLKDYEIDPANIKQEYTRVPAYLATLNQVYAQALRDAILAKGHRDLVFAEQAEAFLDNEILRLGLNYKKPGEEVIKRAVVLTKEYQRALEKYAEAEYRKAQAGGASAAMVAKKDMLVSLGAHVRQEFDGPTGSPLTGFEDDEEVDTDEDDD
jgi:hypothetical protein